MSSLPGSCRRSAESWSDAAESANASMLTSLDVNDPSSAVRKRIKMPKVAFESANSSVTPLWKSPSGASAAAMRGPALACTRCPLNSPRKREKSPLSSSEARSRSNSPSDSTRANAQREAGTMRKIALTIGYAGSVSGTPPTMTSA
jgi:hypothetical protein